MLRRPAAQRLCSGHGRALRSGRGATGYLLLTSFFRWGSGMPSVPSSVGGACTGDICDQLQRLALGSARHRHCHLAGSVVRPQRQHHHPGRQRAGRLPRLGPDPDLGGRLGRRRVPGRLSRTGTRHRRAHRAAARPGRQDRAGHHPGRRLPARRPVELHRRGGSAGVRCAGRAEHPDPSPAAHRRRRTRRRRRRARQRGPGPVLRQRPGVREVAGVADVRGHQVPAQRPGRAAAGRGRRLAGPLVGAGPRPGRAVGRPRPAGAHRAASRGVRSTRRAGRDPG